MSSDIINDDCVSKAESFGNTGSDNVNSEKLEEFQKKVDGLYRFKKKFFQEKPEATEEDLEKELDEQMNTIISNYETLSESLKGAEKSQFLMLLGRVHKVKTGYSKQAEELLYKAAKMNPALSDAWNELGACYYMNKQPDKALSCFQCVLKHVKDRKSLRNISILLRSENMINAVNLQESLKKSQEALECDLNDGESWYNLGNAYLTTFFYGGQPEKILRQALFAYKKALLDEEQQLNPDLYYSLAEASKYTEDFNTALDSYYRAYQLNTPWKVPLEKAESLEAYLKEVDEGVRTKGKTKQRKLELMIKSIKPHHSQPWAKEKQRKPLTELSVGTNTASFTLVKVVNTVSSSSLAFTCCVVDESLTCFALSVLNLGADKGFLVGDSLAISDPIIKQHCITLKSQQIVSFSAICVSDPRTVSVNGRPVSSDRIAPIRVRTQLYNS